LGFSLQSPAGVGPVPLGTRKLGFSPPDGQQDTLWVFLEATQRKTVGTVIDALWADPAVAEAQAVGNVF
jgi:hypothetical protein